MRQAIAIDIGGTTTTFALIDEDGNILFKDSMPSRGFKDFEDYASHLHGRIHSVIEQNGGKQEICGIGIGAPCANHDTGEIEAATDLPWPSPIPLKAIFEKEFGLPTVVANDAKAATIGEMIFGAARGMRNFIMITLGTGVGGGIVCDGHLLSGVKGFAGELGHVTVHYGKKRKCGCGRYDCLQNYCSASGIVLTAKTLLKESAEDSPLRHVDESELTPKFISECAAKGDSISLQTYKEAGRVLGTMCASYAAFSAPEAFIFFGGVANALEFMEPALREAMAENILFLYKDQVKILKSALDEANAALLGASALVFKQA